MKKSGISYLLIFFLGIAGCSMDNSGSKSTREMVIEGNAEVVFAEYEHDFGRVAEGEKVAYVFSFENKGPGDLVIASASTTCGCTVPKYETKPVKMGGKGSLEVVFDTSGRSGKQTKTISVRSNSKLPVVMLKISADVVSDSDNQ